MDFMVYDPCWAYSRFLGAKTVRFIGVNNVGVFVFFMACFWLFRERRTKDKNLINDRQTDKNSYFSFVCSFYGIFRPAFSIANY